MSAPRGMSEESRLQVAVVAGATERANKPRALLLLSGVLLLAAGIYALVQGQALGAARAEIREQQRVSVELGSLAAELRAAHAAQQLDALPRDPQTTAKLERLAKSLGLPATMIIDERPTNAGAPGFSKRLYTTRFIAPDVGLVIEWLVRATGPNDAGLTGMQVNSLKLKPQHNIKNGGWEVDVSLSRIERGS